MTFYNAFKRFEIVGLSLFSLFIFYHFTMIGLSAIDFRLGAAMISRTEFLYNRVTDAFILSMIGIHMVHTYILFFSQIKRQKLSYIVKRYASGLFFAPMMMIHMGYLRFLQYPDYITAPMKMTILVTSLAQEQEGLIIYGLGIFVGWYHLTSVARWRSFFTKTRLGTLFRYGLLVFFEGMILVLMSVGQPFHVDPALMDVARGVNVDQLPNIFGLPKETFEGLLYGQAIVFIVPLLLLLFGALGVTIYRGARTLIVRWTH